MSRSPLIAFAAAVALAACSSERPADAAPAPDAPASATHDASADTAPAVVDDQPAAHVPPATAGEAAVDTPVRYDGFGPSDYGANEESIRQSWGRDLGSPKPDEPGGCYYLIPQPIGTTGFTIAFMMEGDRFVRTDVRNDRYTAPGGGKVGMTAADIERLYAGRVTEGPHKYVEGGKTLRIPAPDGGKGVLLFETDAAGKVTQFRTGVAPQVDYVEGCS